MTTKQVSAAALVAMMAVAGAAGAAGASTRPSITVCWSRRDRIVHVSPSGLCGPGQTKFSFANGDIVGKVKLDVTETEIDWFDLRVVLNVSDTTLTQQEIKLLLNARGNYVRLEGKGWRRLQFDLSEEENERLAALGLNPRELSAEPQRLHALQLADDAANKGTRDKDSA